MSIRSLSKALSVLILAILLGYLASDLDPHAVPLPAMIRSHPLFKSLFQPLTGYRSSSSLFSFFSKDCTTTTATTTTFTTSTAAAAATATMTASSEPAAKLPVYFISHAGPNQAVDETITSAFFDQLGKKWMTLSGSNGGPPSSILILSGHWEGEGGIARVRTAEENPLYYDFYGFPDFMYQLKYPSRGSRQLGERVLGLLKESGIPAEPETKRGLDHGVWVPLLRILPNPQIPIIQMSLVDLPGKTPEQVFEYHIKLGQALRPLREENVLIVASGTAVHNLRDLGNLMRSGQKVGSYVAPFDALLDKVVAVETSAKDREDAAVHEIAQSKYLSLAHPSLDHLLPFHVAIGAAGDDKAKILHKNFMLSLSESSYSFGEN